LKKAASFSFAFLLAGGLCRGADSSWPAPPPQFYAGHYVRRTIYHSPQTPGYTCWAGAWIMPDKSLMICFTQNTGPVEGRPRAARVLWPQFTTCLSDPSRDATDLKKDNLFFRSADGGLSWNQAGDIPWEGPMSYDAPGGQEVVLNNGDILKSFFGYFQPAEDVPQSAYFRRSTNGGKTWGAPQELGDPLRNTYRLTRLRMLRDGRIIGTGGWSRTPCNSKDTDVWRLFEPLLVVSEDGGHSWSDAVEFLTRAQAATWHDEEWDTAELPNGDLLCLFRRCDPTNANVEVRWQGLLKKNGKSWVQQEMGPSPLAHSGHPELLVTREGVILYISTEGIYSTRDGSVWTPVVFPGLKDNYHSRYYPKSIQTEDGLIYVFSHLGWDIVYGTVDEAIVMDTFRLMKLLPR
jgi:hypothetical protein